MDLGVFHFASRVDTFTDEVSAAQEQGFASVWTPQIFAVDALTAIAVAGTAVPRIEIGTAVVPTFPRHPMMLAAQARTVNQTIGGRLALGIGLSHEMVVEGMWGMSFDKPLRHMREYLEILMPLVRGEAVSFVGETLSGHGGLDIESDSVPVIIAALGPKMLALAGRVADGTTTWMTGPRTLEEHIVPTIQEAAAEAGRPSPRVVASLPVCVTTDVADASERASKEFSIYGTLPSYKAMLDREGVDGPAGVAVIGTAAQVGERISAMADLGVTDFVANEFGTPQEMDATRELLVSLL